MRIVLGESVAPWRASYPVLKHLRPVIKRHDVQLQCSPPTPGILDPSPSC